MIYTIPLSWDITLLFIGSYVLSDSTDCLLILRNEVEIRRQKVNKVSNKAVE